MNAADCAGRAPPSMLTLLEIHKLCPEVFERMEVFLDGGIRRGTDILKALSLGVTAVGLGRPFLYSLLYGEEGAYHLVNCKFCFISMWVGTNVNSDEG